MPDIFENLPNNPHFNTIPNKIDRISVQDDNLYLHDSEGNQDLLTITQMNAMSTLTHLRCIGAYYENPGDYYTAMTAILQYSRGNLQTWQVYTRPDIPLSKVTQELSVRYLESEEVWILERVRFQRQIIDSQYMLVKQLSDRLNLKNIHTPPGTIKILAARGNTAVGKTTSMRSLK